MTRIIKSPFLPRDAESAAAVAARPSTYHRVPAFARSLIGCDNDRGEADLPGVHDTHAIAQRLGLPALIATMRERALATGRDPRRVPTLLDVGCHTGGFVFEAARLGVAFASGIDSDPDVIRWAQQWAACDEGGGAWRDRVSFRTQSLVGDGMDDETTAMRVLTDAPFDIVLCLSVLHHLRDPGYALWILRRLVAPGGALLLETEVWRDEPVQGREGARLDRVPGRPDTLWSTRGTWGLGWYPTEVALERALVERAGFARERITRLGPVREHPAMWRVAWRCEVPEV